MTRKNFFLFITSHHDVSEKTIFWKQENQSEIFDWGLLCQARQAKKTSSPWKIIEVSHLWSSGRGRGTGVLIFEFFFFFQNSWSGAQTYLGTDHRGKSPLDGATDFLATIWKHITTVSFSQAFILVLTRKPKNASKRLWIGPIHNSVHFKSLCRCLPIDRWSCVHPVYTGKRL